MRPALTADELANLTDFIRTIEQAEQDHGLVLHDGVILWQPDSGDIIGQLRHVDGVLRFEGDSNA